MAQTSRSSLLSLIDAIKTTVETTSENDAVSHGKLLDDISALMLAAETPLDTIYRIGHQHWQAACIRTALDLGIFDAVVEAGNDGIDNEALARKTGAENQLILRIVRVLVAVGLCQSGPTGLYRANEKSTIMTRVQGISSFKIWFDLFMPTAAKMPEYLRTHQYHDPRDNSDSAFAYAFGSDFWAYLSTHPSSSADFNSFMQSRREGRPSWFAPYPVEENLLLGLDPSPNAVLLIDIGGGRGHDLEKFETTYPNHGGRLVLQDQPNVISNANFDLAGIESMPHDFFMPQPFKGARAYHFRAIFHDWPDEKCKQILEQVVSVMQPGYSRVLISEFILPDDKARPFPASLDVQMMGLHAGRERSESQWRSLLDSSGLTISGIWQKLPGGEGVIEAVLPQ